MITTRDLDWLAGIFEGEACFAFQAKTPKLMIATVDLDVIERIRILTKSPNPFNISKTVTGKNFYRITICGTLAISWMMTLYPLLSIRRKTKIREVITIWKNRASSKFTHSPIVKARVSLTRKLRRLDFTDDEVRLASNLKQMGLSDEIITSKIEKLRAKSETVN